MLVSESANYSGCAHRLLSFYTARAPPFKDEVEAMVDHQGQTALGEANRPPETPAVTPSHGELTVGELARFLERQWVVILLPAVILGVASLVVLLALSRELYKATATLVIVPPAVSSELRPEALSVHGYQRLLQSDAVLAETARRLKEAGVRENGEPLKYKQDVDSRIFVSRRQETTSLAPILEAVGRDYTPEDAAAIANTWAAVFLEHVHALSQAASSNEVVFIERQYPITKEEFAQVEASWIEQSNRYHAKLDEVTTAGDRRIATFSKETASLVAEHRVESRQLVDKYLSENLTRLRDEDRQSPDMAEAPAVVSKLLQLGSIRALQAQTTPILVLEKAMTEEAVWQALIFERGEQAAQTPLEEGSLRTQEANPIYTDLALRAIQIETELWSMPTEQSELVAEFVRELGGLQAERSTSLSKLQADRSLGLTVLRRRQEQEMAQIERERDIVLRQLTRNILQLKALEEELRADHNQAVLAKAQEEIEAVHLAARAVPVDEPESRLVLPKSLGAALIGALVGLVIAIGRESRDSTRSRTSAA